VDRTPAAVVHTILLGTRAPGRGLKLWRRRRLRSSRTAQHELPRLTPETGSCLHLPHPVYAAIAPDHRRTADPPKVWMNASASRSRRAYRPGWRRSAFAGRAPRSGHEAMDVPWTTGRDFTARVARDWEAAFFEAEMPRTRRVACAPASSSVPCRATSPCLLDLVRISLGGAQAAGGSSSPGSTRRLRPRRRVSHRARRSDGPFHLAAPNPLPNRDFMAALREAWRCPTAFPPRPLPYAWVPG